MKSDSHRRVMKSGRMKNEGRPRVITSRPHQKHVGNGRIRHKRGRNYTPYLLIATVLCRNMPMYSATNEVEFLRRQSQDKEFNDDHAFDLSGAWSDDINVDEEEHQPKFDDTYTSYLHVVHHVMDDDDLDDDYIDGDEDLLAFSTRLKRSTPESCHMDSDSYPIGVDTYASRCISPHKEDFLPDSLVDLPGNRGVRPFGKGTRLAIAQKGILRWSIQDDNGITHKFQIHNSLYVPDGTMRLLSPQHLAVNCDDDDWDLEKCSSTQYWNRNILRWGSEQQYKKTVFNSRRSNVPTFHSAPGMDSFTAFTVPLDCNRPDSEDENVVYVATAADDPPSYAQAVSNAPSSDMEYCQVIPSDHDDENIIDLIEKDEENPAVMTDPSATSHELQSSNPQAEFMRWHYRLGHMPYSKMKRLSGLGVLPKGFKNITGCKCKTCLYATQTRTKWRTKGEQKKVFQATRPGQCVSVDQLESTTEGFYGQLKGNLTRKRYKYATVFVDHYSRFTYVHTQSSLTSEETVAAKEAFEAKALEFGVKIEHYHADNGRFQDNGFRTHVKSKGQHLTFCGVNAHWQNGIAEKAIRDLKESARSMVLHATDKWPGATSVYLWPYAMRHAAALRNATPFKHDDASPLEKFTSTPVRPNLNTFHTFGCPVYVLNNQLQQKKPIPTWQARSRLGIYLGHSLEHARSVSLVLSLTTGLVSPQFHVEHDDFFESLGPDASAPNTTWMELAGFTKKPRHTNHQSGIILPEVDQPEDASPTSLNQFEQFENPDVINYGRGRRVRRVTQRMQESMAQQNEDILSYQANDFDYQTDYYQQLHQLEYVEQEEMTNPVAFKASTNPDIMYYHQAMKAPDKKQFKQAIVDEVNAHIEGNHWELVPLSEVPKGTIILDSVWAMRRKRDIKTREVYKWKARLNMHGGQQIQGIHYDETYSPVVQWSSVRLALTLSILNNWATRQIDFVLAFPQADLDRDNYMKLPKGICTVHGDGNTHVLKIKKNLYGGKNAGKIWYDYLKGALINIGFKQSSADSCVFYRGKVIFMYYVDDGLLFCPDSKEIDKVIADLRNPKKAKKTLKLDDQGDIKDYLGINFERGNDDKIRLTQPQIVDDILEELGITEEWTAKPVPAPSTKILCRDAEAESVKCPFDYRKVIGKLNFLEKSTRPDIAYAVHQCARFSSDPKQTHIDAVMYLGRYLKGTRNKGVVIDPKAGDSFEVWADADWSGNWNKETAEHDPSTAKSRSGYLITLAGCPILWASKLQTMIALSSCEAEYICLSQALRETIPLMNMVQELKDREFISEYIKPTVHCKAFEDNSGCVELAKVHKLRPRTKHINIAYHHFREAVREGKISIHQVKTDQQLADVFTKPLQQNLFVKFRMQIMGW